MQGLGAPKAGNNSQAVARSSVSVDTASSGESPGHKETQFWARFLMHLGVYGALVDC